MADSTNSPNIRQLCLRLKPILGSKIDQIYEAYLSEDSEGKKQVENYLELLAAKYIFQELGQPETILLPRQKKRLQVNIRLEQYNTLVRICTLSV